MTTNVVVNCGTWYIGDQVLAAGFAIQPTTIRSIRDFEYRHQLEYFTFACSALREVARLYPPPGMPQRAFPVRCTLQTAVGNVPPSRQEQTATVKVGSR